MLVVLALTAFFAIALPDNMFGVVWPYMRVTFDQPLAAMTLVLPFGVAATVVATTGWTWAAARIGLGGLLTGSLALSTVALLGSALAPDYWVILLCAVLFGLSAGAVDAALNAYAARHFGPRLLNFMHAAYGIGAAASPLAVTVVVSNDVSWRWAFVAVMVVQGALTLVFAVNARRWGEPPPAGRRAPTPARPNGLPAIAGLLTVAVESGLEAVVGLWAFVYLLEGLALPASAAGLVVSGYWAALVVARVVLGALAGRAGTWPVVVAATGLVIGAAGLLAVGRPIPAATGVILLGLAAAPIYPLLVATTAERTAARHVDRLVGFQAAASTIGSVAFASLTGLVLGSDLTLFPFCVLALALLTAAGIGTIRPGHR
jgi:MFS family permease